MPFKNPRSMLLVCIVLLGGCGSRTPHRPPDLQLLATDVHVAVAEHALVLPFVALEDHASGGMSFSLDRAADRERATERRVAFLRDTRDDRHPLELDLVSVAVYPYGETDLASAGQLCPTFSRQWARSMCTDTSYVVRRALPPKRFKLVDLAQLRLDDPRGPANCLRDRKRNALPSIPGRAVLVCPALVFGGDEDGFHIAVVRIDGDLGAMWTVWRNGQGGESAEAMATREGNAIALFVDSALGKVENHPKLVQGMSTLQRPQR
ncbi:hypothetical protein [Xanthomonas sp. 1678]|uniref:hypothetical protein n=1 Tax=Xanthomonas sp. 1678 TaxID=3158788 RepID=UPI00286469A8|nr:hypothetical protein [Xanthomonas translucens]